MEPHCVTPTYKRTSTSWNKCRGKPPVSSLGITSLAPPAPCRNSSRSLTCLRSQVRRQQLRLTFLFKVVEGLVPAMPPEHFFTVSKTGRKIRPKRNSSFETSNIVNSYTRNDNRSLEIKPCRTSQQCLFVGCLTSQQHASVSQGRICTDNFKCCHTEIEAADQTFYLTQSQYTDTGPISPSADPITPSAWQGSHWSTNFWVTGMTRPRKNPGASGIRTRDLPLSRRTPYQ